MILIIAIMVVLAKGHLIIAVSSSNSIVSQSNNMSIKILTTSSISTQSLSIRIQTDFTAENPTPCSVNGTSLNCTTNITGSLLYIYYPYSFSNSANYTLYFTIINPQYSANFAVSAYNGSSAFANAGVVGISPQTISCGLTGISNIVGDVTIGTFSLQNTALPSNSQITINTTLQTTLSNLFTNNPICSSNTTSLSCSLSNLFFQQILQISSVPTNANLSFNVSFINNPPFNGSYLNVSLQIQNSNSQNMQICSTFSQTPPSVLQNSSGFSLTGWNSQIGSSSSIVGVLTAYFQPISNILLLTYNANWQLTFNGPTIAQSSSNNSITSTYLTSVSESGSSLYFSGTAVNPTSLQPLNLIIYVLYSNSLFMEQYTVTNLNLTILESPLALNIQNTMTMAVSAYNFSLSIPFNIIGGFSARISISFGSIQCSNLGLITGVSLSNNSCNESTISFSSNNSISLGLFYIILNIKNYISTKSNSANLTLLSFPQLYPIYSSSISFNLSISSPSYTIINNLPQFASGTNISISQNASINLNTSIGRIIHLYPPSDMTVSSINVISSSSACITPSFKYDSVNGFISINIFGILTATVIGITNPIKYNGSRLWNIIGTDLQSNPSSNSTAIMTPQYTPVSTPFNFTLSTTTIEAMANLTIIIIPMLQYYIEIAPTITISLSNSIILSPCPNCTSITSSKVSFTYTGVIMNLTIGVKNSVNPFNNTIMIVISYGSLIYQTNTQTVTLTPMIFGFTSSCIGQYQQIGNIIVNITSGPTTAVSLSYSDVSSVIQDPICMNCNQTYLKISGIILYFQNYTFTINGTANGVLYAQANITVSYECAAITGCRICSNTSSTNSTLICSKCFASTLTIYNLLYKNQCIQQCPITTYSDNVTCIACAALCYNCTISTCLECVPNYYLYNSSCVNACPVGYIHNATTCLPRPILCPQNCVNCIVDNVCPACVVGYFLVNNYCTNACPTGYVIDSNNAGQCILFVPPEEAKYFPFAFLIVSLLLLLTLSIIKCFEKRSLMMGNFIAFLSFLELGSMIMTLVYTLQSSTDLLTQALCFIVLLSKVMLNVIFLIYFVKVISIQEEFVAWRNSDTSHENLYKALLVLSASISFQAMRIIYSRLLGLRLFFGKFNTSLIFKPMNYFTLVYLLTTVFAIIFLSVRNIINQNGYKTSTFYTSTQTIIIECLLIISCIIDNKKGHSDQFFDYQIYKVNNEFESSNIDKVQIEYQAEAGGSTHQLLRALKQQKTQSQLRSNSLWRRKTTQVQEEDEMPNEQFQLEENDGEGQVFNSSDLKNNKSGNGNVKNGSFFRTKIINDWKQLQKSLPNRLYALRKASDIKSYSPNIKKRKVITFKKSSSVQKVQVKLPQLPISIPDRIKQHFHRIEKVSAENEHKSQKSEMPKSKLIQDIQKQDQYEDNNENIEQSDRNTNVDPNIEEQEQQGENDERDFGEYERRPHSQWDNGQLPLDSDASNRKLNRYDDQFLQDQQQNKGIDIIPANLAEMNLRMSQFGQTTAKRQRLKGRKVNRQTQSVYLQRLTAGQARKRRNRQKDLKF